MSNTNTATAPIKLVTCLAEIRSFNPCPSGWIKLLAVHGNKQADELFPLEDCLLSNAVADVLWLIGKRKTEIKIAVEAANGFAESVKKYNNSWVQKAVNAAIGADVYAAANAANATKAVDAAKAAYAVGNAVAAANAAIVVADAAVYAAAYAAAAAYTQHALNKQILLSCIRNYEQTILNNQLIA